MNNCPTGCGRPIRPGHLMCRPCWVLVPGHLQRDVINTWRTWEVDFGDADAMNAYITARDEAIRSIP